MNNACPNSDLDLAIAYYEYKCNFVINEVNPNLVIQSMVNKAFQNALFLKASFPNGNEDNSYLPALLGSFDLVL